MDLAHQVLLQLPLAPQVVNMAVMLHQQLLQQLLQTLGAVRLLLQLQVAVESWQNQSLSEEMCCVQA
jgi:hypothetical protein